jgi:DNA-binding Lrp family transcriptional regulator
MKDAHQDWTFFSNHGHVYFLLAAQEGVTIREVANRVGLTERAVIGIIGDLVEAGYIRREKVGRNNRYFPEPDRTLRHPLEANVQLHDLRRLINQESRPGDEGNRDG